MAVIVTFIMLSSMLTAAENLVTKETNQAFGEDAEPSNVHIEGKSISQDNPFRLQSGVILVHLQQPLNLKNLSLSLHNDSTEIKQSNKMSCCQYGDEGCDMYISMDTIEYLIISPLLKYAMFSWQSLESLYKRNELHLCWNTPVRLEQVTMADISRKVLQVMQVQDTDLPLLSTPYTPMLFKNGTMNSLNARWTYSIQFLLICFCLLMSSTLMAISGFFKWYQHLMKVSHNGMEFYGKLKLASWMGLIYVVVSFVRAHVIHLKYCLESKNSKSSISYQYYLFDSIFGLALLGLLVAIAIVEYPIIYIKVSRHVIVEHEKGRGKLHLETLGWCGVIYFMEVIVLLLPYFLWYFLEDWVRGSAVVILAFTLFLLLTYLLYTLMNVMCNPYRECKMANASAIFLYVTLVLVLLYIHKLYGDKFEKKYTNRLPPYLKASTGLGYLLYAVCAALFGYFVRDRMKQRLLTKGEEEKDAKEEREKPHTHSSMCLKTAKTQSCYGTFQD